MTTCLKVYVTLQVDALKQSHHFSTFDIMLAHQTP